MPTMSQIDPNTASGRTKEAFDEATRQFGGVINLFRVAGNAPNVLKGFLALNAHLNDGAELTGRQVELVAMLVSALNHCDYCVNVHMKVGMAQGATEDELIKALAAKSDDPEIEALLEFTNAVVRNRGMVPADVLSKARNAGFSDKALLETIGVIGQYTLIQYVRHVADPDHDFPMVGEFDAQQHGAAFG